MYSICGGGDDDSYIGGCGDFDGGNDDDFDGSSDDDFDGGKIDDWILRISTLSDILQPTPLKISFLTHFLSICVSFLAFSQFLLIYVTLHRFQLLEGKF